MKDNMRNNRTDDQSNLDQDKLRDSTMNETIREVNGNPDTSLNNIRASDSDNADDLDSNQRSARRQENNSDLSQGMSYTPNDASGVRSGGISDMDDQNSGGAGSNTAARRGSGSHLKPKTFITGSDYDGQNSSS